MDEIMNNATADEEVNVVEEQTNTEDSLKDAINEQIRNIQRRSILIGSQAVCSAILEKIMVAANKPGKRSMNDYKRLIKDIEGFCKTGLSRKINADGEVEIATEDDTVE